MEVRWWSKPAERVLLGLWVAAVIIVSIQAAKNHANNFEIFRTSWLNLSRGNDLYSPSTRHYDVFIYTPSFALVFALGVLIWNALNAATLYWSLGRILTAEQAFLARLIVFADAVGSMQQAQ